MFAVHNREPVSDPDHDKPLALPGVPVDSILEIPPVLDVPDVNGFNDGHRLPRWDRQPVPFVVPDRFHQRFRWERHRFDLSS